MYQQKQYLVQQINELRKENNVYKNEFKEIQQEIKNYKALLKKREQDNSQLRNYIHALRHVQGANLRLRQENINLKKQLRALEKKHTVHSKKPYADLSENERKTIRNRLDRMFTDCLKNVSDWFQAVVCIQFKMDDEKFFWDRKFINDRPQINEQSAPSIQRPRWHHLDVLRIIHVTDKFLISNEAYRELRMVSSRGLPSSYRYEQLKNMMSESIPLNVSTTPEMDAAYRGIREVLRNANLPPSKRGKYFIKFSADGAVVSRDRFGVAGCVKVYSCNKDGKPKEYINIPQLLDEHPVFYYFGQETYEVLRQEAASCFEELMDLQNNGFTINRKHHLVEILITCDWKCLCVIQGVNNPSANHFCAYCTVHKDDKFKFTVNDRGKWSVSRNNAQRAECLGTSNNKGYVKDPLIDIDFTQCPVDFLHLCNGVIKKQLNQVVCWALDQDRKEELLQEMKRLKVPFRFYTERSSDYKNSILKWTTPSVHELRTIYENFNISNVLHTTTDKTLKALQNLKAEELRFYCKKYNLPSSGKKEILIQHLQTHLGSDVKLRTLKKMGKSLQELSETEAHSEVGLDIHGLQKLWEHGNMLLLDIRDGVDNVSALEQELLDWGVKFMNLTFPEDITPYIHTFIFHAPEFVRRYGGLGAFAMEEVERLNKVHKLCFFGKTHQGRDPKESALLLMRLCNRRSYCRTRQLARDTKKKKFFDSRQTKFYNRNISSDESEMEFELDTDTDH